MKTILRKIATLLFCSLSATAVAQNPTHNYVSTRTMLDNAGSSFLNETTYYDGLGRPFQKMERSSSSESPALFDFQEYDAAGRLTRTWNKVYGTKQSMTLQEFRSAASTIYQDPRSFSESGYEASPLNRSCKEYAPGNAWATHPASTEYLINTSGKECLHYSVNSNGALVNNGTYEECTLHIVRNADEDNHEAYTFTDFLGRTVLERQMNGNAAHDTYYVYDDFGNLRFVLQPMYQETPDLGKYAFLYQYDHRNRCVWKKLPGADPVTYEYDSNDRLVFSQDGNQRASATKKWTYYKYNNLNRLTERGECTDKSDSSSYALQVRNYYDNYDFVGTPGFTDSRYVKDTSGYGKGFLTGSEVSVFGSGIKIHIARYYDIKGNEVRTVQNNLLGGYDVTETVYTFTGKPQTVTHTHTASGKPAQSEVYTYTYDYANRISKVEHTLNGVKVTLADYLYNDLGQLKQKNLHGLELHRQEYKYNIRGWLTHIGGIFFGENLYYNTGNNPMKCYNGNISSVRFSFNGPPRERRYQFRYDGMNRLTDADFDGWAYDPNYPAGDYSEHVTAYDKNGNILGLKRNGEISHLVFGQIDDLTYTLDGNRVTRVDDASTTSAHNDGFEFKDGTEQVNEYAYDANGNLTKDLNKNIVDIQYNCLNLPSQVFFEDGDVIVYDYDANGTKLRTVHVTNGAASVTDYCGNVVYENGIQKLLLTEEGYVTIPDGAYHYFYKDHLGNIRLVMANPTASGGNIEERNDYYPFGGLITDFQTVQPYKYNGKELDTKKGLNWYDYGARHYDAALGRFTTNDRFAEKYYSLSPYQYGANNPIRNIDMNGDSIVTTLTTEIDGKMTNIDYTYRTDANGEYAFFDAQGSRYSGDDSFMNSLTDALSNLRKGKVGNALVSELMNSERTVNIANRKNNSADSNGAYITWNPSSTEGGLDQNGSTNRPSYIGLGHEMAHIQDVWKGSYDGSLWAGKVPNAEKYATHVENQLRSEHGLPLRTHYGVLDTGRGDPQTPLLRKGTGVSLYYKRIVGIGGVYVPTTPYIY